MTANGELDQFCIFGDKLITLSFPFIGKPHWDRFELLDGQPTAELKALAHFEYYGRGTSCELYDAQALDIWRGCPTYPGGGR